MFIDNKYKRWYDSIIQGAIDTPRDKKQQTLERHHIIPDCLFIDSKRGSKNGFIEGNPDDPSNLVYLTAREHFICHLLLIKFTQGIARAKMVRAAHRLRYKPYNNEVYKLNSRLYQTLKEEFAKVNDFNNREWQIENGKKQRGKKKPSAGYLEAWVNNDKRRELVREIGKQNKGTVVVVDIDGNKNRVNVTDERIKTGELAGHTKGKTNYINLVTGETVFMGMTDERLLTGEWAGHTKGRRNGIDKDGKIVNAHINDERWASGELKVYVPVETPAWIGQTKPCEHCGRPYDISNYNRHIGRCHLNPNNKNYNPGWTPPPQKAKVPKERRVKIDGVIYDSVTVASRETGVSSGMICYRLKKKYSNYEYVDARPERKHYRRRVCIDGVTYNSISEAAKALDTYSDAIRNRIYSPYYTGYSYVDD